MSITDATTSVTTAWTEAAVVDFTAATLSNEAACVTEVESKLRVGTLAATTRPTDTEVKRWLGRAKQELAEVKNFTWRRKYASASTAAGTYRYGLPPDFGGGRVSLKDTTNDRYVNLIDEYLFDRRYPDVSAEDNDIPLWGCIKNMELWLSPPPAGVYTLELEYDRSGAETTASDFTFLPEIDRYRCCDFALYESFLSLHNWQAAAEYKTKWEQAIGKAIRADGKRRWKRMNYQATDWDTEYKVQYYQRLTS